MTVRTFASTVAGFMGVSSDNPELLKAQYRAFSRQLPMMYFILISSTWAVALAFRGHAPNWLAIGVPLLLTAACVVRVLHWWRSRRVDPTPELALRALKRTNRLASIIAAAFTAWSLALFPYGDPYTRSYLAFYMAITVIACIFCLMHLRSAAVIVTVIVSGVFIAFFRDGATDLCGHCYQHGAGVVGPARHPDDQLPRFHPHGERANRGPPP